jgi:hypothetical protein
MAALPCALTRAPSFKVPQRPPCLMIGVSFRWRNFSGPSAMSFLDFRFGLVLSAGAHSWRWLPAEASNLRRDGAAISVAALFSASLQRSLLAGAVSRNKHKANTHHCLIAPYAGRARPNCSFRIASICSTGQQYKRNGDLSWQIFSFSLSSATSSGSSKPNLLNTAGHGTSLSGCGVGAALGAAAAALRAAAAHRAVAALYVRTSKRASTKFLPEDFKPTCESPVR